MVMLINIEWTLSQMMQLMTLNMLQSLMNLFNVFWLTSGAWATLKVTPRHFLLINIETDLLLSGICGSQEISQIIKDDYIFWFWVWLKYCRNLNMSLLTWQVKYLTKVLVSIILKWIKIYFQNGLCFKQSWQLLD